VPTILLALTYMLFALVTSLLTFSLNPLSTKPRAMCNGRVENLWLSAVSCPPVMALRLLHSHLVIVLLDKTVHFQGRERQDRHNGMRGKGGTQRKNKRCYDFTKPPLCWVSVFVAHSALGPRPRRGSRMSRFCEALVCRGSVRLSYVEVL
jgi:hypothetical protein